MSSQPLTTADRFTPSRPRPPRTWQWTLGTALHTGGFVGAVIASVWIVGIFALELFNVHVSAGIPGGLAILSVVAYWSGPLIAKQDTASAEWTAEQGPLAAAFKERKIADARAAANSPHAF